MNWEDKINWLIMAFEIPVIASVYAVKLTQDDMPFGWIYGKLTGIAARHPWTEYIFKPIMICVWCVTGQMALWTLILYGRFHLEFVPIAIHALFFLSLPFVIVEFVNKVWRDE